jgi:UDP-glucose 4-epimerase
MTNTKHKTLSDWKGPVLVTGGCGYIGSHVCLALKNLGIETIVVDDLSRGFKESLVPSVTFYQENFGNRKVMEEILKKHQIKAVLHFAAYIAVEESVYHPYDYYQNNTCNTLNLLQSVLVSQVPYFIFSSTAAVYGTPQKSLVVEQDPIRPESPYGQSKAMSEQMLRDLSKNSPLRYVILRYFNVAGAHHRGGYGQRALKSTHLIKVAAEAAMGKRPGLEIFGDDYPTPDGTCVRDFIHIDDLAHAHVEALRYLLEGNKSDTFNCGYGQGYSVKEVIAAMEKTAGKKLAVTKGPRRAGDAVQIVADPKKIKDRLHWQPRFNDLSLIVKHAYDWEVALSKEDSKVTEKI